MSDPSLPHMTNIKELVETGPIAADKAKRAGGRRARMAAGQAKVSNAPVQRNLPPRLVLGPEAAGQIHQQALKILAETGVEMRHARALQAWQEAGAQVDATRVRISPELMESLLRKIPRAISFGPYLLDDHTSLFAPSLGARHVIDTDGIRHSASLELAKDGLLLISDRAELHFTAGNVLAWADGESMGEALAEALQLSSKPMMVWLQNEAQAEVVLALKGDAKLLAQVRAKAPLLWEEAALACLMKMAAAGQPVMVTGQALAGASSPADMAASLAMMQAGIFAGLGLTQLMQEGSAHLAGQYVQAIDMRSGAPMAGNAEASLMRLGFGELCRHAGLFFAVSGALSSAKTSDAQAGFEAAHLMQAAIDCGAHIIFDAAGGLENGDCFSFSKFMLDCDQLEHWRHYAQGLSMQGFAQACDVISEVGPLQHFLGTAHTLENFRHVFHVPQMFDFGPFVQWEAEGARDADQRGREMAFYRLQDLKKP